MKSARLILPIILAFYYSLRHHGVMELLQDIIHKAFALDSIWSVVARGAIWLAVSLVIIVSADNPDSDKSQKNLRSNLGFFLMFITLTSGLVCLLFGFTSS